MVFGMAVLQKFLKWRPTSILLLAIASIGASYAVIGFAKTDFVMYMSLPVGIFYGLMAPMNVAFVTFLVEPDEVGFFRLKKNTTVILYIRKHKIYLWYSVSSVLPNNTYGVLKNLCRNTRKISNITIIRCYLNHKSLIAHFLRSAKPWHWWRLGVKLQFSPSLSFCRLSTEPRSTGFQVSVCRSQIRFLEKDVNKSA